MNWEDRWFLTKNVAIVGAPLMLIWIILFIVIPESREAMIWCCIPATLTAFSITFIIEWLLGQ